MTCIVGVKHRGHVFVGADSACSDSTGSVSVLCNSGKLFQNGPYIIGCTGYMRYAQIMAFAPLPPPRGDGPDLLQFMCTEFVDAVRKAINDAGGMERHENSREESMGQSIIGIKGRLFVLGCDFSVTERLGDFEAVGCGSDVALGAMAVSQGDPAKRIVAALNAAAFFCNGVRAPFCIIQSKALKK